MKTRQKLLYTLIIWGFSIVVLFGIGEIYFRVQGDCTAFPPSHTYRADNATGFWPEPNREYCIEDTDFKYRVKTNSIGLRGGEIQAKDERTFRILGVGDSFVFGEGVQNQESFLKTLEASLTKDFRVEVINAGIPGYGTRQEAVLVQRLVPQLRPDLVILGFYQGNDIQDSLGLRDTTVVNGHIVSRASAENFGMVRKILMFGINHSKLFGFVYIRVRNLIGNLKYWFDPKEQKSRLDILKKDPPELLDEGMEKIEENLLKIQSTLSEQGALMIVMAIPSDFQVYQEKLEFMVNLFNYNIDDLDPYALEKSLGKVLRQNRIPYLPLLDPYIQSGKKNLYFPHDGHLSVAGHKTTSEILQDFLKTGEIIPDSYRRSTHYDSAIVKPLAVTR